MLRAVLPLLLLGLLALLLAACGSGGAEESDGRLRVVSTVSPITSIVESIGGDRLRLEGVVPEGQNSHTFDPSPSLARLLAEADLIIVNGLFLEEPTIRLAEANKRADAPIVRLGDRAISPEQWQFDFSFPESGGQPNPHLWPDPNLGLKYAETVAAELSALDPDNAAYYQANLQALRERLQAMDAAVRQAVATIPAANRKLLTYHDSWAYFAVTYDMEVIGAVQPSDFAEPSPQQMKAVIDQIRATGVPAVFGSAEFPSAAMDNIVAETGVRFIDRLSDDDLPGAPGDPRHSYLGLMQQNMEAMIPALGGSAAAVSQVDVSPVFQGDSGAIYPQ